MRDAPVTEWTVTPHHTYFIHVQSAPEADAVGLVVVQIGDGSEPCIGRDSHPDDKYAGHVFVVGGQPKSGVEVQYFRNGQFITETLTDDKGRHSIRLAPGFYEYRFLMFGLEEWHEVLVPAGKRVKWELIDAEGAAATIDRPLQFVTEDLVCNWDGSDGESFNWTDVIETIDVIAKKIDAGSATLRLISFSHFPRPDILKSLQMRGLWAIDNGWRDMQFSAAFRNMMAMAEHKALRLKNHAEANLHLRNTQMEKSRLIYPDGTYNYLALARAGAVYQASSLAGAVGGGLAVFDPMSHGGIGGVAGAGVAVAGTLRSMFGEGARIVEQQFNPKY